MKKKKAIRIIPLDLYQRSEILKWKKKYQSRTGKELSKKGFG